MSQHPISQNHKIYVAGHRGMVGSAIVRQLLAQKHPAGRIVTRTHAELDLTDQSAVRAFFNTEKPDQVYLAAAKVGGIHANNTYPADFIYQNLMIEANVIDAAFRIGVKKLLFLGSSCIYPRLATQPMSENALLTGVLESTNEPTPLPKLLASSSVRATTANTGKAMGWITVVSCQRLRAYAVDDALARSARRLRHCHWRAVQRATIHPLEYGRTGHFFTF